MQDIFQIFHSAKELTSAAEQQLSPEGFADFKCKLEGIGEFVTKLPQYIKSEQEAATAKAMDIDEYEDGDISAAKAEADSAVEKAADTADKENVRCHAYHIGLKEAKRARLEAAYTNTAGGVPPSR